MVAVINLLHLRLELAESGRGLPGRQEVKAQPRNQRHKHKARGKKVTQSENWPGTFPEHLLCRHKGDYKKGDTCWFTLLHLTANPVKAETVPVFFATLATVPSTVPGA